MEGTGPLFSLASEGSDATPKKVEIKTANDALDQILGLLINAGAHNLRYDQRVLLLSLITHYTACRSGDPDSEKIHKRLEALIVPLVMPISREALYASYYHDPADF